MAFTSACGGKNGKSTRAEMIEITDMLGRKTEVPQNPEKVIGVGPGALRLLVYMGLSNRVSGVEDLELRPGRPYAYAISNLEEKPLIGPRMGGDSELIAVNKPDVIFMSFSTASDADDLQRRTNIPVVALKTGDFRNYKNTLFRAFDLIGRITGKKQRSDSLKTFIINEIEVLDSLSKNISDHKQATAYVGGISYRGNHGISSTEEYYAPFEFVNIKNVAGELREGESEKFTGTHVDVEQIIEWNPGFLFIDAGGLSLVRPDIREETPLSETLSAIKNQKTYIVMPHNFYSTNFEHVLINSWYIGKVVYPEKFSDIDFEERAFRIYRFMLGTNVYEEIVDLYDGWQQL